LQPMGLDVQVSARYLTRATELAEKGLDFKMVRTDDQGAQVDYPHPAHVFFIDNRIDPGTSTFLVKAAVPNPDKSLLPGEQVRIEVQVRDMAEAVVVPEQAVMETQAGPTVFVVNDKNEVASVVVEATDYTYEGLRVIDAGLSPGQKVVVEGLQIIRPGMKVKTEDAPRKDAKGTEKPDKGKGVDAGAGADEPK